MNLRIIQQFINRKSDVFSAFKDFVLESHTHFNVKIANLYCDNGREYLFTEMKDFFVQNGTSYHFTVPRTPQLNGVAERMIRTVSEKSRSMLAGANLDESFWSEATLKAVYLTNLTLTAALNGKKSNQTLYELKHGKKPILKYLKVFDSTVYIHNKIREKKIEKNRGKAF